MNSKHSVLIVDDDPVALALLTCVCEGHGLRVYATQSPEQAYSIALSGDFQIVIANWDMPGMLGIELCTAVRHHKFGSYVYFILVSAHEGSKYLQTALDAEVDHYLPKPLNTFDLKLALNQATRFVDLQLSYELLDHQLPSARKHVELDMAVLRYVQTEMMPKHLQKLGDTTVHIYNKPFSILSGDQCGAFEIDENTIGFFLVDVVGHGFHAAVQAFGVSSMILRDHSDNVVFKKGKTNDSPRIPRDPGEVLTYLNALYLQSEYEDLHICAIYGMYNRQTRQLQLALAGMPHPYLLKRNGELLKLGSPDLPLGLFSNVEYSSCCVQVEFGDQLLLMSDGLYEVVRGECDVWGAEGVEKAIQESGLHNISALGRYLLSRAKKWAGTNWDSVFSDDVTLLGFDLDSINESETPFESEIHSQLLANSDLSSSQLRLPSSEPIQVKSEVAALPPGKSGRVLLVFDKLSWAHSLIKQLESQSLEVLHCSPKHLQRYNTTSMGQLDLILMEYTPDSEDGGHTPFPLDSFVLQRKPQLILCHEPGDALSIEDVSQLHADSVLCYPISTIELRFTVKTAMRHARIQELVQHKASQLQTLRDEIRVDLERVAMRQATSLPVALTEFPNLKVESIFKPAYIVSGDFLGLFKVSDQEVGFFSIDARGQGVLGMIQGWLVFRILTDQDGLNSSPAAKLQRLNRKLLSLNYKQQVSCSGIYGVLNTQTGLVRIANAAHPAGILVRADGHSDLIHPTGPRLGENPASQFQELEFYLNEGRRLHIFSDGLYQTLYPQLGKEDGYARLSEIFGIFIEDKPALLKSMLEKSLATANPERVRDVSMLVLELAPAQAAPFRVVTVGEMLDIYHPLMPETYARQGFPMGGRVFKMNASSRPSEKQLGHVRSYVSTHFGNHSDSPSRVIQMILDYSNQVKPAKNSSDSPVAYELALLIYPQAIALIISDDMQVQGHELQVLDLAA